MRDKSRIKPFLAEVTNIWEKYPDLRFGQLVMDVIPNSNRLWNIEEDSMLEAFHKFDEGVRGRREAAKKVKAKLPNTPNFYGTNNLFAVSEGRGDYHFRLYFNDSDGLFYMELGDHLANKSDYESMTTIKIVLQEFVKWMAFMEYRIDTHVNLKDYRDGNIWIRRGFESIETAFAVFKAYAIGYISDLPWEEFALVMKYFDGSLQEKMREIADPELKDMLMGIKGAYVDFVVGMLSEAHNSKEKREVIIKYIAEHPEANSSDVIENLYKNFKR